KSGPDGEITTSFEYDGIQRLVRVTDTEGNVTTSTYDMGDRRTEVNHPASGITSFTYDALGNVLTKQTANLAKEGKFITYDYDYQRLTGINYPDHPENNVKYYYGGRNASQNRIGRLMLREDGTGAIEYFYGKMGEVTKTRRTMIVPNQAIATYVTQWTYDSHNRLLEMIYPDEEKITYSYNLGGQLEKVHGYKSYGYDYVSKIGYDKFEQRTYLKYCNGAETFYTYDPQRRRLQNLTVNSGGNTIMDNAYTYDAVSNVLSVVNGASVPQSGKAGGQMAHAYTYDALYRLVGATGTYTGADNKTASYTLAMGYDNMHRITSKRQILTQNNVQFNGTLNAGYDLSYTYGTETGKKFQLANVKDVNYRTEETPSESENVNNNHAYEYDANGNLVYVNTSRTKKDGMADEKTAERKLKWDEENRLLASDDNGFVTNYWYDADGERTVKTSGESDQVYVNSEFAGGRTNTAKFLLYVSPYLVANQGGRYTKHIYIGSQRVVSKIGDFDSYGSDPRRIQYAGSETDGLSVDYKQKYVQQLQVIKDNYATFAVPYNGEDNNDYVDGKGFCCNDGSLEAAQARAMARAAKNNFQEGDSYEKMQFYYHPDHLGSSSYITNLNGEVVQHIEYVPFGEVFVEERNNIWNTPYLFNAKEFDEETGLYYYGARYYDPRVSLWISTDPAQEEQVIYSSYCYTKNSPLIFVDPTGEKPTPSEAARMAAHIYGDKKDDILIGGWKKSPDNLGLNLKTSCGLKSAVYMRTDAKGKVLEYAYVTAGTEAEWADVAADLTQPFGLSKQYSNSADNAKSINSRVKGKELTFIGHSLGGGEAALNALVTDRAAITFNPAGVSDITKIKEGSWLTPFKSERNIDAYIMYTDPLNIIQDKTSIPKANGKRHYLVPTDFPSVYNGHSMDNVLKNFGVKPDKYNKE
ncbi:MAG: RHS repeat-associated core domain-containing protein, partial [Bacteroides sp.]|uniref:RHS repeat-associated core domain-containing protein n=1 Tax=Bacteroides sp. TaxID=29523 RepID=UPI0029155D67